MIWYFAKSYNPIIVAYVFEFLFLVFLWSVFCLAFVVVLFFFLVGLFIENIWSSVFHSSSWENVADIAENQTDWKLRFSFQTFFFCMWFGQFGNLGKFIILVTKTYWEHTIWFELKIIPNILTTADQAISCCGYQLVWQWAKFAFMLVIISWCSNQLIWIKSGQLSKITYSKVHSLPKP